MKDVAPKLAVNALPAAPPLPNVQNGTIVPDGSGIVIPPVLVAGLAVGSPFQLPEGAARNQILRLSTSTATPITSPAERSPRLKPVETPLDQIFPVVM
jgi:hypothetical protein